MPLARVQRLRLARVLAWSRANGWVHDAYPNTWRSSDGNTHIRFDGESHELVVDRMTLADDPLRCRVALVPVDSIDVALRVLAALGHIPTWMTVSGVEALHYDLAGDDDTRATYRALMTNGRHAYISTYCQHGLHDDCRRECKCCGAPCVCSGCLHTVPPPADATGATCTDPWCADKAGKDEYDGPANFVEAGQAFADLVDGRVCTERAAEVLSRLAQDGLIVSVAYHEEACAQPAGQGVLFGFGDFDDMAAIYDEERL